MSKEHTEQLFSNPFWQALNAAPLLRSRIGEIFVTKAISSVLVAHPNKTMDLMASVEYSCGYTQGDHLRIQNLYANQLKPDDQVFHAFMVDSNNKKLLVVDDFKIDLPATQSALWPTYRIAKVYRTVFNQYSDCPLQDANSISHYEFERFIADMRNLHCQNRLG